MTPWSQIASAPPLVGAPGWGSDVMIRTREGRPVATGGLLTHFGVTVCSWQRTQRFAGDQRGNSGCLPSWLSPGCDRALRQLPFLPPTAQDQQLDDPTEHAVGER